MPEESIRVRDNGQINVILRQQREVEVTGFNETEGEVESQKLFQDHQILMEMEEELEQFIGLKEMKKILKEIYAWVTINKQRQEVGLKTDGQMLHMLFKGNPGTGKTTMARLVGKMLFKMNVLSKGHFIEAERADLVGEYIGHTALKTRELIKKSQGGILFIDEAYSLGRGGEKDFGREAIDTIVKHVEDKQHDFIVILAGYSSEMQYFVRMNPGLASRFPIVVNFPDYTSEELLAISEKMLKDKQYKLSVNAKDIMYYHLKVICENGNKFQFSNARYVRNIIEKAIRSQSIRLLTYRNPDRNDLMTIRSIDLGI
ncbi:MAG: Stage sporulation protein whose disruption leads to the production of immature spores SpoVK [Bacillales bacterium]|nr:Stage sporulation protein whose disruption leads to the production of immature spores SpoVK [Bacillales bacterium]